MKHELGLNCSGSFTEVQREYDYGCPGNCSSASLCFITFPRFDEKPKEVALVRSYFQFVWLLVMVQLHVIQKLRLSLNFPKHWKIKTCEMN